MGKKWKQWQTLFSWAPKSLQMVATAMKLKDTCSLEEKLWQTQYIKKQRHYFANKGPSSQNYFFPVVMYRCELDHKEGWALKIWSFQTVVLEKTPERVPWTARRTNQSILKETNPEYSSEGLMVKAPILWPHDWKSQLTGRDPDARKDWGQEENWVTEDEMVGWHHRLNKRKFEQTPGDSEGQGSLAYCSLCGSKSRMWLSNWRTTTNKIKVKITSMLWVDYLTI